MTAQHLRPAARQMKLASSGVDPHVGVGHHQKGIAGEPKACDIEQRGEALVRDLDVDVLEMDRVAEIFFGSIELLRHGRGSDAGGVRSILDDRFHESGTELEVCSWIPRFEIVRTRIGIMATWRHAVELAMDRGGNWHVER